MILNVEYGRKGGRVPPILLKFAKSDKILRNCFFPCSFFKDMNNDIKTELVKKLRFINICYHFIIDNICYQILFLRIKSILLSFDNSNGNVGLSSINAVNVCYHFKTQFRPLGKKVVMLCYVNKKEEEEKKGGLILLSFVI